ncbi:MAG: T9SS type A sorting domain-containing protein [Saprospiraceae bacterium]|nr:T9SS type A sorting domain-containing protein [Saprospiraceae bacterium]
MNTRGDFIDSTILKNDTQNLFIDRLIPISDGYIGLGQITNRSDSREFFWVFRLNKQLQQLQDTIMLITRSIASPAIALDRDSNIIFTAWDVYKTTYFGKITKTGNLQSWKIDSSRLDLPANPIIAQKDSLLYTVLYPTKFVTFDTTFNKLHEKPSTFSNGLNSTLIILNDSTVAISGKTVLPNVQGYRLFFGVSTLKGRTIYKTVYSTSVDTAIWSAWNVSADTTKTGEWYWGGTYNFILGDVGHAPIPSSFILHKLNRDYSIKWTKRYGGDAYYEMYGVLTTDDGGCIMYGTRYDYNSVPKYDAYILKVNGEGLITSESSIPLSINNLHIYPNPSSGLVNFDYKEPLKDVQIRVIDTKGSLVHQVKIAEGLLPTLDLSFLNKGSYFIQIMEQNKIFSVSRWVKQR